MTDEDRELLKLAANAAGMKWIDDRLTGLTIQRPDGDGIYNFHWNPLRDDGEAMRLATKLGFCISHWPRHTPPYVMVGYLKGPDDGANWIEDYEGDPDAATRRAVTCAAAEVGKTMEPIGVRPPLFDKDPTNIQY